MGLTPNILVLFLWFAAPVLHPLHLTVSNVDYKADKGELAVSIKIFRDDLELALSKHAGSVVNLLDEQKKTENDSILNEYIGANFRMSINNKLTNETIKDTKIEDEAVWVFYGIETNKEVELISLENRLLTELYDDQKNLVIVGFDSQQKAFTLSGSENSFNLNID